MSRKPRKLVDSGFYHIVIRGNNQQNIFFDKYDRNFFINRINKYVVETGIELYAYSLMDNHVHFLIGNGNKHMALFMKKLECSYVYYFNHKYNRTGHLFQGRYKSEPIETIEYFKTVYRYILQNAEKAHICSYDNYEWSSLHIEKVSDVINYDFILSVFGSEHVKEQFLSEKNDDVCMENTTQDNIINNDDNLKLLFIKQLFSINELLSLSRESIPVLKQKLRLLKKCGLSINQISRLTGVNRYIINKT